MYYNVSYCHLVYVYTLNQPVSVYAITVFTVYIYTTFNIYIQLHHTIQHVNNHVLLYTKL